MFITHLNFIESLTYLQKLSCKINVMQNSDFQVEKRTYGPRTIKFSLNEKEIPCSRKIEMGRLGLFVLSLLLEAFFY